ncbi:MAG: hypothetical protein GC182_22790 [Rhodopseudomonas sp.]|nr:hypothetical protein [Rhodopseudomonas sp.]
MHQGHDHHHHHHGDGATGGVGHNHVTPLRTVQWQTPHKTHSHDHDDHQHGELDLDLVEAAFAESFASTSDPASFLRLAHIPSEAVDAAGTKLVLLRVESEAVTDVGSLMPHLGGGSLRYDPLPAQMVTRRRKLRFVYYDGQAARLLKLAEVRDLKSI